MSITEKSSYLRGLAEGLELDSSDKTNKLIGAIVDTIDEIAHHVSEIEMDILDISEQIDAVDEDLAEVEEYLFEGEHDLGNEFYEVCCPECEKTICVDESVFDEVVDCPSCGQDLAFEVEEVPDSEDEE